MRTPWQNPGMVIQYVAERLSKELHRTDGDEDDPTLLAIARDNNMPELAEISRAIEAQIERARRVGQNQSPVALAPHRTEGI